jgi:hypothetical protein
MTERKDQISWNDLINPIKIPLPSSLRSLCSFAAKFPRLG